MANRNDDLTGLDESVMYAVMAYLLVLVVVPLVMKKNDPFVNFHAKQGLLLFIGIVLALVAASWLPRFGNLLFLVLLLLDIIGLVQALLGRRWKIPLIGDLAQKVRL